MSRKVLGITAHFRRQDGKPELDMEKINPDWSYALDIPGVPYVAPP